MAVLHFRSQLTDKASATASSGWNKCMAKSYCKWPAIIGILFAVIILLTALFCLFRCLSCCCCDCLSGGRYRKRKHKYADLSHSPYANNPTAFQQSSHPPPPPGYVSAEPPRYAQFESSTHNADSLPSMPTWGQSKDRRVYEDDNSDHMALRKEAETLEMSKMENGAHHDDEQRAPMLAHHGPVPAAAFVQEHAETDASSSPSYYQQYQKSDPRVAPTYDRGLEDSSYGGNRYSPPSTPLRGQRTQEEQAYRSYSAYATSESTRYEPSAVAEHSMGTAHYGSSSPPGHGGQGEQTPSVLQAGRKPVQDSWRDV